MDASGSLVEDIETANWTSLRDSLILLFPSGVVFNFVVLNESHEQMNSESISNGIVGNRDVTGVEYLCVSTNPSFRYYLLRGQLAVAI